MRNFNALSAILLTESEATISALVTELRRIADDLEATPPRHQQHPAEPDIIMDASLCAVKELRDALDRYGDDLLAVAALGRNTMARIAELAGLSESAIPIRLARTGRLEQYATTGKGQPRVTSRGLGAATW